MKVIFIKDLKKQGKVNEVKEVKDTWDVKSINIFSNFLNFPKFPYSLFATYISTATLFLILARQIQAIANRKENLLSEWRSSGDDMINPRMGHTMRISHSGI